MEKLIIKDTEDKCSICYENGVVEITKEGKKLRPYKGEKAFTVTWPKDGITYTMRPERSDEYKANRFQLNYREVEILEEYEQPSLTSLISLLCQDENEEMKEKLSALETEKYDSFRWMIGSLVHRYSSVKDYKIMVFNINSDCRSVDIVTNILSGIKHVDSIIGDYNDYKYRPKKNIVSVLNLMPDGHGCMSEVGKKLNKYIEGVKDEIVTLDTRIPKDMPKIFLNTWWGSEQDINLSEHVLEINLDDSSVFYEDVLDFAYGSIPSRYFGPDQALEYDNFMFDCVQHYFSTSVKMSRNVLIDEDELKRLQALEETK